jgi:hypothetical protein
MRCFEDCDADQTPAFIVQDNAVIAHVAMSGIWLIFKMDIEDVSLLVIIQPHVGLQSLGQSRFQN